MFNIQGSELIFLLLIALVILGPEKLPEAVRKFGKTYGEFKKMANGFQGELRSALDEPMREMRDTADAVRKAARFDDPDSEPKRAPDVASERPVPPERAPIRRDQGLNFGTANPKRQARMAESADAAVSDSSAEENGTPNAADNTEPGAADHA